MHSQRPPRGRFQHPHQFPVQQFQRNPHFAPRGRGRPFGPQNPKYQPPQIRSDNNEKHWCETCDRDFFTLNQLKTHEEQHQKCNIDGCQFVAHPKVVTMHIQMQHSTGLYEKIGNLKDPEDIRKWREERKQKYPTKKNIEKKAAEIKEKNERGEKMGMKRNYKFNKDQNLKRNLPNENAEYKKRNTTNPKRQKQTKKVPILPPPDKNKKLRAFAGIMDLVIESNVIGQEDSDQDVNCIYNIEDDDCLPEIKKVETTFTTEEPTVCGALSSLMCEYGTSDDETEAQEESKPKSLSEQILDFKSKDHTSEKIISQNYNNVKEHNNGNSNVKDTTLLDSYPRGEQKSEDESPEELKIDKPVWIQTNNNEHKDSKKDHKALKSKHKSNSFQTKQPMKRRKPKVPSTLLRKLLQREIQQERNIVLQCIRHIVVNNYFDK